MTYTQEQMDKLYRQERGFAVRVDDIWRAAKGVYIAPADSGKVQVVLNGKFVIIEPGHILDLQGYTDAQIAHEVVRRNLSSLPPAPKKKFNPDWMTMPPQTARRPAIRRRTVVAPE